LTGYLFNYFANKNCNKQQTNGYQIVNEKINSIKDKLFRLEKDDKEIKSKIVELENKKLNNQDIIECVTNKNITFNNTVHNKLVTDEINAKNINAKRVITYSDRTLKKNITPINSKSALDKINKLQGVYYNWKDEDSEREKEIGFIAQDVNEIIPNAVITNHKKLAIKKDQMIPLLVEAVKELNGKKTK